MIYSNPSLKTSDFKYYFSSNKINVLSIDNYPNCFWSNSSAESLAIIYKAISKKKQNIYLRENRGYPLKHVDVYNLPTTSEWTMILKPQANESFYFLTAFPGKPALPIPHHEMGLTQKNACIAL